VNRFLTQVVDSIEEEAEATRGTMGMAAAVECLIDDRVTRGILNAAEAATIRAEMCASCRVIGERPSTDYPGLCVWCGIWADSHPEGVTR